VGEFEVEVVRDEAEKEKIIEELKLGRLRVKRIFAMNNPWARNRYGNPDRVNLALYVEFIGRDGETYLWLPTEGEFNSFRKAYIQVRRFNQKYNSGGREWRLRKSRWTR
jgi:hypothetical protein